jgi:hypothetical protein
MFSVRTISIALIICPTYILWDNKYYSMSSVGNLFLVQSSMSSIKTMALAQIVLYIYPMLGVLC